MPKPMLIEELVAGDNQSLDAAAHLLVVAFDDCNRYNEARIRAQLLPSPAPFYRKFFLARQNGAVNGVGGIKAADWATDTHILFLSAVAEEARGQGIAKALTRARIEWVQTNFSSGRLLVSTAHKKRFATYGFRPFSKEKPSCRTLMVLEF